MQRLSFEESWKVLRDTTNLLADPNSFPDKVGIARYGNESHWIDYYKHPELNDTTIASLSEEGDVWKLENLTMPGVFFCRCGFFEISFRNTSLINSIFTWNDFVEVDFTNADLSHCDLRCSIFRNVQFVHANLCDADLRMSTFENCDFTDAEMAGTKLTVPQAKHLLLSETQKQAIAWKRGNGSPPKGG